MANSISQVHCSIKCVAIMLQQSCTEVTDCFGTLHIFYTGNGMAHPGNLFSSFSTQTAEQMMLKMNPPEGMTNIFCTYLSVYTKPNRSRALVWLRSWFKGSCALCSWCALISAQCSITDCITHSALSCISVFSWQQIGTWLVQCSSIKAGEDILLFCTTPPPPPAAHTLILGF